MRDRIGRRQVLSALGALAGTLACKATPREPAGATRAGGEASGAATSGVVEAAAPAAASGQRQPSFVPVLLSREQALMLEDLAELILPETDTPGARRAGVPAFVEAQVADVFEDADREIFIAGLAELERAALAAHGASFQTLGGEQQGQLLAGLVTATRAILEVNDWPEPVPFFLACYEAVIEGYCRSKLGATRTLQYEPVPGDYAACVPLAEVGRAWALN